MKIQAKKQFGQNFLKDESIKNKIIQSIPDSEKIVEIGPGLGDLTHGLLSRASKLWCFEIDKELEEHLKKRFESDFKSGKIELFMGDALQNWDKLSSKPYFLAANLPYYIATNMILRALSDENCLGFVVMIQREVALKFCAKSGDKENSALALLAGLYGQCELLFSVPASAFEPEPKVTSAVIRLIKTKKPDCDIKAFEAFLKVCFIAPRKTLAKNLNSVLDKDKITKTLEKLNISQNTRPHELDLPLFLNIFKEVQNERREKQPTNSDK